MDPDGKWTSTRAVLLAAAGQNRWPPAGSYMAATGQDLMAADTGRVSEAGMCWLVVRLHLPVRAGRGFLSSWGCWFRCTAHEAADTLTVHRQSHQEQSQAPSPSPNQSLCGRWQRLWRGLQGRPAGDYSPKCDDCSTAPRPSGPAGVAQRHQPSARGLPGVLACTEAKRCAIPPYRSVQSSNERHHTPRSGGTCEVNAM